MNLKIKKKEQGPVLAAKGDPGVGSVGNGYGVTVDTGPNSNVGVGANANGEIIGGYSCNF